MSSGGAIWIHRKALESWLWELPAPQFKVAMTILLKANWKPGSGFNGGEAIRIDRGELLTSLEKLAAATKTESVRTCRTTIHNCEKADFLTRREARKGQVICVTNYDSYQARVETIDTTIDTTATRYRHDSDRTPTTIEEGNKGTREEGGGADPLAEKRSRDQRRLDAEALWSEFIDLRKPLSEVDRGMRSIGTWPGCHTPLMNLLAAGWKPDQIRHAMACEVAAAQATRSAQYFDGVRNFTDDALRRCQGRTPANYAAEAMARKTRASTGPKAEPPRPPKKKLA